MGSPGHLLKICRMPAQFCVGAFPLSQKPWFTVPGYSEIHLVLVPLVRKKKSSNSPGPRSVFTLFVFFPLPLPKTGKIHCTSNADSFYRIHRSCCFRDRTQQLRCPCFLGREQQTGLVRTSPPYSGTVIKKRRRTYAGTGAASDQP